MNAASIDPKLWLLISPALPVGGYSYSQGLEQAVQRGWISSLADVSDWIGGLAGQVLPSLDLAYLTRMHRCLEQGEIEAFRCWNHALAASRETAEMLDEDLNMGMALQRLLSGLAERPRSRAPGVSVDEPPFVMPPETDPPTFAASFARACSAFEIDLRTACSAYAWIWCENQVAAAVKLVPLGQTDGQWLLLTLADDLELIVERALSCPDAELGRTCPGLAIASAAHETQYSRIFRS